MRGRSYEQHLAPDCLEWICQSYADFFSSYSDAPLLMINALEIDFVANEQPPGAAGADSCFPRRLTLF